MGLGAGLFTSESLATRNAVPRLRERERVAAGRVRVVGEKSSSIHIREIEIHIQAIGGRSREISAHIRAIRIYIRANATRSREIRIYSREIASYIREIAADSQEMAANIGEIAGYTRRSFAAALKRPEAAHSQPFPLRTPHFSPLHPVVRSLHSRP